MFNLLYTLIIVAVFNLLSIAQPLWEKKSDAPPGVTEFKIYTFYENGVPVQYSLSTDGAGLFKSIDGGVTWESVGLNGLQLTGMAAGIPPINDFDYVVASENGVYKTIDGGQTWTHHTSGIEGLFITDVSVDPFLGFIRIGTSGNGVYRSYDSETWESNNSGMENETVIRIRRPFTTEDNWVATTINGGAWKYNKMTQIWEQINQGNNNLVNNDIIVDPEGKLYLASDPDILSTTEAQNFEWQFEIQFLACENFAVTTDNRVFAASLGLGVRYRDLTGNWIDFSEGLPEDNQGFIDVKSLDIDSEGYVWAAVTPFSTSLSPSIYKTINPVTDVKKTSTKIPENFKLEQNYPNPFNPSTAINFSIPEASFISLKIYNSLGQEVETLVADELSAGTYKYDWNAENLTSGIYFYKLQSGSFVETKKMILLK